MKGIFRDIYICVKGSQSIAKSSMEHINTLHIPSPPFPPRTTTCTISYTTTTTTTRTIECVFYYSKAAGIYIPYYMTSGRQQPFSIVFQCRKRAHMVSVPLSGKRVGSFRFGRKVNMLHIASVRNEEPKKIDV